METKQAGRIATRMAGYDRNRNGRNDDEYYGVLRGAKLVGVPGIILEHSFHTQTRATKWLLNDSNVRKLAVKEAEVIAGFYELKKTKELTGPDMVSEWAEKDWKQAIVDGIMDGINPQGVVTREMMAVIIYRFKNKYYKEEK